MWPRLISRGMGPEQHLHGPGDLASMWPRLISRGMCESGWELAGGFDASMWPRLISRGMVAAFPRGGCLRSSFNVAAADQPRPH